MFYLISHIYVVIRLVKINWNQFSGLTDLTGYWLFNYHSRNDNLLCSELKETPAHIFHFDTMISCCSEHIPRIKEASFIKT